MKDILQWIPNFFKGMVEVLKELQKMAGGGRRGQIVFWVFFIIAVALALLFIGWAIKPAYDNMAVFFGYFNIHIKHINITVSSSLFPNLLLSLLLTLISVVFMIGFAGIIGAFLGMLTNAIFPGFTTYRIDKLFSQLIPILKKTRDANPSSDTEQILTDANKLYERWQTRFPNKITRFITTKTNRDKYDKMKL